MEKENLQGGCARKFVRRPAMKCQESEREESAFSASFETLTSGGKIGRSILSGFLFRLWQWSKASPFSSFTARCGIRVNKN